MMMPTTASSLLNTLPRTKEIKMLKRKKSTLRELRLTILGDRNVGKTAMVVRFITRRYIGEYDKGSDIIYRNEMIVDQDTVLYEMLDASSPITLDIKRFQHVVHTNVPDLYLLLYSTTDRQSFIYVRNLLKHLIMLKANGLFIPPVAIIGNKNDLIHLRQVSFEEGENLCTDFSDLSPLAFFGEISVADHFVNQLFMDIYRWVKKFMTNNSGNSINGNNSTNANNNKVTSKPPMYHPTLNSENTVNNTNGNQNNNKQNGNTVSLTSTTAGINGVKNGSSIFF